MKIEVKEFFTVITPEEGYKFSNLDKSEMYEGSIYLGKYDSPDNYVEVTLTEYEEWKVAKDQEIINHNSFEE